MQRKFDPRQSYRHHNYSFTSLPSSWFCLFHEEVHPQATPKLGNKISSSHSIPHNFIWHYPEREKRSLQAALEEQRGSFPFPGAHTGTGCGCVGRNQSVDMEIKSDQTNQGILEHGTRLIHLNPKSWKWRKSAAYHRRKQEGMNARKGISKCPLLELQTSLQ